MDKIFLGVGSLLIAVGFTAIAIAIANHTHADGRFVLPLTIAGLMCLSFSLGFQSANLPRYRRRRKTNR